MEHGGGLYALFDSAHGGLFFEIKAEKFMETKAMEQEAYRAVLAKHPTIETERALLRRFCPDDAEDMFAYASDPEVTKYLTFPPYQSVEQVRDFIESTFQDNLDVYAITNKGTGRVIGSFGFMPELAHNKTGLGYALNCSDWNRGLMTEILSRVMEILFLDFGFQRVESTHYLGNMGSGRVMEKCGMVKEGVLRREKLIKGEYVDVVHYGILREDYLAGREQTGL